jgi:DNA ligase-1
MDFSEIHSRRGRTVNLHNDFSRLEYHVFDLVNGHDQLTRIAKLAYLLRDLPSSSPIKLVPCALINPDLDEILAIMEVYTLDGFEGIIVRHPEGIYQRKRSGFIMKFKPRKSDVYQIVATQEEIDKNGVPKNSLGALICTSSEGTIFGVGSGFTKEQREEYWEIRESLPGMFVRVLYQQISPKHVPRFPIFSEIIPMVIGLTEEEQYESQSG